MKVKPKVIETETALRGFPCKTLGGLIRRQNNSKLKCVSNVLQNNQINTVQSRLSFVTGFKVDWVFDHDS